MSLPLVILLMAILAIAVTAGFARVSEERRIVGDQQAQVDAFAVAQSGLERYVGLVDSVPGVSTAWPFRSGRRHGVRRPLPDPGPCRSHDRDVRAALPGRESWRPVQLQHTSRTANGSAVCGLARRLDGRRCRLDSIGGLAKNGNTGTISGFDGCVTRRRRLPVSWCRRSSAVRRISPTGTPVVPQGSAAGQHIERGLLAARPLSRSTGTASSTAPPCPTTR